MTKALLLQLDAVTQTINLVTNADVHAKNRKRENIDARGIFYKVAREVYRLGYTRIGEYLGKNHATILNGYNKFNNHYDTDKQLRYTYETVIKMLDHTDVEDYMMESKDLIVKYINEKNRHLELKEKHKVFNTSIEEHALNLLYKWLDPIDTFTLERLVRNRNVNSKFYNILNETLEKREKLIK